MCTVIGRAAVIDSICCNVLYTPKTCCSVMEQQVSASFHNRNQNPRSTAFFCWCCHKPQLILPWFTFTSKDMSTSARGEPKASACASRIFVFSNAACCSFSQRQWAPYFTSWYNGCKHWARWGMKAHQYTKKLKKLCNSFTVFGVGKYCILSMTVSSIRCILPGQLTPRKFRAGLGPCIFCGLMAHLLCCRRFSKPANLYRLTLCHPCNEPFSQSYRRKTVTGPVWHMVGLCK